MAEQDRAFRELVLRIMTGQGTPPPALYAGLLAREPRSLRLEDIARAELSVLGYGRLRIAPQDWVKIEGINAKAAPLMWRNPGPDPWLQIVGAFLATRAISDDQDVILAWQPFDQPRALLPNDVITVEPDFSL